MQVRVAHLGWYVAGILLGACGLTLWGGAATAPPAAAPQVRAVEPGDAMAHASILEVKRSGSGGDSDALWQREIATLAAEVQFPDVLEGTIKSDAYQALKDKIPGRFFTAGGLASAVRVRQVPGTSLIAVRVECSEDPASIAVASNALVAEFLVQINKEASEQMAESLKAAQVVLHDSEAKLTMLQVDCATYLKQSNLLIPLPPNAADNAIVDRGMKSLGLKQMESNMAIYESLYNDSARGTVSLY